MKRRKVLTNTVPPWASMLEEGKSFTKKKEKSTRFQKPVVGSTTSSSTPPSSTSSSTTASLESATAAAQRIAAQLNAQIQGQKRKRKKSRFDEKPPASDISATIPLPKEEDPLAYLSDPAKAQVKLTAELATHSTRRKHHISDYLPKEELEKFMAKAKGIKAKPSEKNKIKADNKGFGMLAKMGWKEGTGLGKSSKGITAPVAAGGSAVGGAGIGHLAPTDVTEKDDIFTQYKKRMALAYRYRPNPLGNPRTPYWEDDGMNKGATQKL
mmetsp:Transcript_20376/g.28627  ORF Transcript_20376/g.28627 Transcript_20376/m.28627 type:complete len:268 (-) Transcript_20376:125-928(-)